MLDSDEYGLVDVDDYCHYLAELDKGASVTFEITRFGYGRKNCQRIEIYGSRGGLVCNLDKDGQGIDTIEVCVGEPHGQAGDYHELPIPAQFRADQMQSFFDIILQKSDGLSATLEDGVINQRLLDSIIESFENEKWVYID